jgi:hypothetical protein
MPKGCFIPSPLLPAGDLTNKADPINPRGFGRY